MKLKIEKLLFTRNQNKPFYVIILFFILFHIPLLSFSQTFRFSFENTPLSKALTEIAKKTNIRISFDAGLLEKIYITQNITGENIQDLLLSVLEGTDYTVDVKFDTYLVFKLPPGSKPAVQNETTYQGTVFDKETGERLPYASIFLWNKNLSLSTTVDGTFSLTLLDSSGTFLQIKYLGYHQIDTLVNTSFPLQNLSFGLIKKSQAIQTVEVKGEKLETIDFSNEAGHFTFNPSKFTDLPNYGETDVFRGLQLLPGVSSFGNSSELNIRGSSADQNLVMFDGFTLYNLDHFFGIFSALNPNVIKNIQVYRGGFDSRYGERVSGIVDITGKTGNQQKPEFYGGVNLISANLTTEIPITKKMTMVAAGRRAYSDVYSTWLADALLSKKFGETRRLPVPGANVITPEFYFSDYNLKLTYAINQQENLSFSLYGAKDFLSSTEFRKNSQGDTDTRDDNQWGNYGFGISWKKQWSARYFSNLQLGHSGYFNDYYNKTVFTPDSTNTGQPVIITPDMVNFITNENNNLTDYFVTVQNRYDLDPVNQFEFGISAKYNQFTFYKDATRDFVYSNLNSTAFLYSLFFQDKIIASERITVKPGFRTNFYSKTNKVYIEPRFTASYRTENGLTFKAATGRYYQFLNKSATEQSFGYNRDFWVLADEKENPIVSSNHFIIGASYKTPKLFFDVEGYYKTIEGLQEYLFFQNPEKREEPNPGNSGISALSQFISGNGKAYGIDFLAKYEGVNYTGWLAYSVSKATRRFSEINGGGEIPAPYDQTHEIKWTNIYNYNKWNFSTLAIFTTGKPYIESTQKEEDFTTTRVYNRLPNYFRIDLSANYNFTIKNVNIKPGLSVLNAMDTHNYLDIYTRQISTDTYQFNETALIKAQELTFNFFVNFRF